MRTRNHSHPCQSCGVRTPCDGELEDNYDGEPAITCRTFHLRNGSLNPDFVCEACSCVDCGERATTTAKHYTNPDDDYIDEPVCSDCAKSRENAEPPDPDGEDICRDYQAESRDRMEAARRLK